jgi:hypothetical protein
MSSKERRRLAFLRRRAEYLTLRIEANENPEKPLSFDIEERNALLWAVEKIEQMEATA